MWLTATKIRRTLSRGISVWRKERSKAIDLVTPRDGETTHPISESLGHMFPYPPVGLQYSIGAPSLENFLIVADGWTQAINQYLKQPSSLLDIGCGCGRTARLLVPQQLVIEYVGFDILLPSIEWCNRVIASRYPKARFIHSDIHSSEYNPEGIVGARDYRFPVDDESIDIAFAASLFTHLLTDDAQNYLRETFRCLKRGGVAILSIHNELANRTQSFVGTEARIDMLDDRFLEMSKQAGFKVESRLGKLCGQEVFVLQK